MHYTETFKARMVRRMLGPKAVSATTLAQESGVSQATLSRWLRETATFRAMKKTDTPESDDASSGSSRRPQDWSPEEKLRAVVEDLDLEEEKLGEYLRHRGLHREQLEQWRADAHAALERPGGRTRATAESKRIKELERDLRKKEKALAETAALLVLRKKADALWGDGDDDTDGKNEL
jgi:transposase-like protein